MTEKTFPYLVVDREIQLKIPTEGQLAAAMKILEKAKREIALQNSVPEEDKNSGKLLEYVAKILRIIDMMIVSEEDRDYVEDMMIEDKLKLEGLVDLIQVFGTQQAEEAPKAGPKPKSRARRAS